ncbi:MAG: hypothetical protein AAGH67_14900, partial [Cyanobacteria bacterium P01_H01_bin.162]
KEDRNKKAEACSVRTLIQLEIQQNIDELEIFWGRLQEPEVDSNNPQQISSKVFKLSKMPIPPWTYKAWESQMSKVPAVFMPWEIVQISNAYKKLMKISNLLNMLPNREIDIGIKTGTVYNIGDVVIMGSYDSEISFLYDLEALTLEVLKAGNPLASS